MRRDLRQAGDRQQMRRGKVRADLRRLLQAMIVSSAPNPGVQSYGQSRRASSGLVGPKNQKKFTGQRGNWRMGKNSHYEFQSFPIVSNAFEPFFKKIYERHVNPQQKHEHAGGPPALLQTPKTRP